jgi:RNA polymerase sigma factor (sigma-70 family)
MDASEREQYRAAIHGDREVFEMIIRTHSRTLFAIAYGILQNREEAKDVVQDSLVKAWNMRWRVRDPEKFPAWLSMIARHRAHDVFRKRRSLPFTHETIETTETNDAGNQRNGSTITLGARHVTGATSRRAHSSLFRRHGLSKH